MAEPESEKTIEKQLEDSILEAIGLRKSISVLKEEKHQLFDRALIIQAELDKRDGNFKRLRDQYSDLLNTKKGLEDDNAAIQKQNAETRQSVESFQKQLGEVQRKVKESKDSMNEQSNQLARLSKENELALAAKWAIKEQRDVLLAEQEALREDLRDCEDKNARQAFDIELLAIDRNILQETRKVLREFFDFNEEIYDPNHLRTAINDRFQQNRRVPETIKMQKTRRQTSMADEVTDEHFDDASEASTDFGDDLDPTLTSFSDMSNPVSPEVQSRVFQPESGSTADDDNEPTDIEPVTETPTPNGMPEASDGKPAEETWQDVVPTADHEKPAVVSEPATTSAVTPSGQENTTCSLPTTMSSADDQFFSDLEHLRKLSWWFWAMLFAVLAIVTSVSLSRWYTEQGRWLAANEHTRQMLLSAVDIERRLFDRNILPMWLFRLERLMGVKHIGLAG